MRRDYLLDIKFKQTEGNYHGAIKEQQYLKINPVFLIEVLKKLKLVFLRQ